MVEEDAHIMQPGSKEREEGAGVTISLPFKGAHPMTNFLPLGPTS
jgi:hypothetical protein